MVGKNSNKWIVKKTKWIPNNIEEKEFFKNLCSKKKLVNWVISICILKKRNARAKKQLSLVNQSKLNNWYSNSLYL